MLVMILNLMKSCSNLPSSQDHSSCTQEKIEINSREKPEIPFTLDKAFLPLRYNKENNKIVPSYSWDECMKRFVVCLKWQRKIHYFNDLEWFYVNEWGLTKRPVR